MLASLPTAPDGSVTPVRDPAVTEAQRDYLASFDAWLLSQRDSDEEAYHRAAMDQRLMPVLRRDRGVVFAGMSLGSRQEIEVRVMEEVLSDREREVLRRYMGSMKPSSIAQLYREYENGAG